MGEIVEVVFLPKKNMGNLCHRLCLIMFSFAVSVFLDNFYTRGFFLLPLLDWKP